MNIIDAIKSGKMFRRKNEESELWLAPFDPIKNQCFQFLISDILAEDWEVESQPVTITREQFDAAWDRARTDKWIGLEVQKNFCERDDLARELGL